MYDIENNNYQTMKSSQNIQKMYEYNNLDSTEALKSKSLPRKKETLQPYNEAAKKIIFQGKTFLIDPNKSVPIRILEHLEDKDRSVDNKLLTFLNKLRAAGILDKRRKGQIIIADD